MKGVTANVICTAMLGGDEYPASAIGINLPNADWIRAEHGSKSVTISNLTHAYDMAARVTDSVRSLLLMLTLVSCWIYMRIKQIIFIQIFMSV